jgi:hypothetical protein
LVMDGYGLSGAGSQLFGPLAVGLDVNPHRRDLVGRCIAPTGAGRVAVLGREGMAEQDRLAIRHKAGVDSAIIMGVSGARTKCKYVPSGQAKSLALVASAGDCLDDGNEGRFCVAAVRRFWRRPYER